MNKNMEAGADIHAGDGGYSEGTQEKYEEFVKNRNQMNDRIREITGQVLDELVPETWVALGYDKIKEIQYRTAELIVRECASICELNGQSYKHSFTPAKAKLAESTSVYCGTLIKKHFGVEE